MLRSRSLVEVGPVAVRAAHWRPGPATQGWVLAADWAAWTVGRREIEPQLAAAVADSLTKVAKVAMAEIRVEVQPSRVPSGVVILLAEQRRWSLSMLAVAAAVVVTQAAEATAVGLAAAAEALFRSALAYPFRFQRPALS
jgi:hypothetical protein